MRLMPLATAIIVSAFLYFLVFERDRLMAVAGSETAAPTDATDEITDAAVDETLIKVVVQHSQEREIESAVVLRGRTEAARAVVVRAETSGQVSSEPLRKGAFVNAGDTLCQIDVGTREASVAEARARLTQAQAGQPQAAAALVQAQASVREAEVNLNAARALRQDGYATETRLVSAEAAYEAAQAGLESARGGLSSAEAAITSAEAALAAAERELSRITITAPFAGILETDTAELGSFLTTGGDCATVIQLDPIKLVAFVPELDVNKVTVGAPAAARLAAGGEVMGRVTFLSRAADETTRTFRTEVEVANADLAIRDGQTAEIIIGTYGRMAHLVPQSALTLNDEGALGLRLINADNVVEFAAVDLLRDTVDGVWVSGLPATADIITVGQEYVVAGVKVAPVYAEAAK